MYSKLRTTLFTIALLTTTVHQQQLVQAFSMSMSKSQPTKPTVKLSQTQEMTKPQVWNNYKKTLIEAGVLDLQKSRPIGIKAINIGSSAENSMRGDGDSIGSNDKSSESFITSKIIHFQRHGQGFHNLLGDVVRASGQDINIDDPNPEVNPFVKPEIQDSPLTFQGRTEATSRRYEASMLAPQLIVVSPLVRAVQTALLTFADHIYVNEEGNGKEKIPLVAHEGCREQLGLLTCNKALPLSQTKTEFPEVDFSLVTHDEDDHLWNQYDTRESPINEANRAYDFLTKFIMEREEEEIAVVCHSAWLFSVCNAVIDCSGDESLESWFGTGEIRSCKVSFFQQ